VPKDDLPSGWPDAQKGTTIQKATVFVDNELSLGLYAQLVDITPIQPTELSSKGYAPDTHEHKYGYRKLLMRVKKNESEDGVVWQDENDRKIYVTWFLSLGPSTIMLQDNTEILMAAVGDGGKNGNIIFLTMSTEKAEDKTIPQPIHGFKVASNGLSVASHTYDTSYDGLNVYSYSASGISLAWNVDQDEVAWMFPRVMLAAGDGRNYQACSIPILDAENLQIKRKLSGYSHSWANFVTNHKSGFLAVDLGDNYPRGVNTHLLASEQTSKVVYQFKTHHATHKNGKDIYDDISTPEKNCQPNCQPNCQSNRQPNCQSNCQPNRYKYIFTFL